MVQAQMKITLVHHIKNPKRKPKKLPKKLLQKRNKKYNRLRKSKRLRVIQRHKKYKKNNNSHKKRWIKRKISFLDKSILLQIKKMAGEHFIQVYIVKIRNLKWLKNTVLNMGY